MNGRSKLAQQIEWRDRIVGQGKVAPADLLANPKNWRMHPQEQQDAMSGILDEVGWVQQVIVNRTTGLLIDGHLRLELAKQRGEALLPVVYVELSEAEEDLVLAALDPIGGLAGIDGERLSQLLADLNPESQGLQNLIAALESDLGIGPDGETEEKDVETLLDQAVQLQPGKDYVVIVCDTEDEFEAIRTVLKLQMVRRGGYKPGSAFDATGIERVIPAPRFLTLWKADHHE